jgi:DNA-binding CsgD family transcriptional regulator
MSLAVLADHMASKGRNGDSMLVHMTPDEVRGLHALAEAHGGGLTINPETGLPEANFLKRLLPTIIGAALAATGIGAPMAALMVGGFEAVRTGDLSKGIMAGLGAYGGAGIGSALSSAGATTLAGSEAALAAGQQAAASQAGLETVSMGVGEGFAQDAVRDAVAKQAAQNYAANLPVTDRLSAGLSGLTEKAGRDAFMQGLGGTKGAFRNAYMAATPLFAAETAKAGMPQTTTQMGKITPYVTDEYGNLRPAGSYNVGEFPGFAAIRERYGAKGGLMGLAEGGVADSSEDAFSRGGMFDFTQRSEPVVRMADGGVTPAQLAAQQGILADPQAAALAAARAGIAAGLSNQQIADQVNQQYGKSFSAQNVADFMASNNLTRPNTFATPATTLPAYLGINAVAAGNAPGSVISTTAGPGYDYSAATLTDPTETAINAIYNRVLGRQAEQEGLNYWANAVRNKTLSLADVEGRIKQIGQDIGVSVDPTQLAAPTAAQKTAQMSILKDPQSAALGLVRSGVATGLTNQQIADLANETYGKSFSAQNVADFMAANNITRPKPPVVVPPYTPPPVFPEVVGATPGSAVTGAPAVDYTAAPTMGEVRTAYEQGGGATKMPVITDIKPTDRTYTQNQTFNLLKGYLQANPNALYSDVVAFARRNGIPDMQAKAAYNEFRFSGLTGGSSQAYDYLMGRGAYPVAPFVPAGGKISRSYAEMMGLPTTFTPKNLKQTTTDTTLPEGVPKDVPVIKNPKTGSNYSSFAAFYFDANPDVREAYETQVKGNMSADDYAKYHYETLAPAAGEKEKRKGYYPSILAAQAAKSAAEIPSGGATGGLAAALAGGGMSRMRLMGVEGAAKAGGHLGDYSDGGRLLRGPGDGVSDSIPATIANKRPARLADGEFVVPARIVSELGNGSTEAGARKLYAMMDRVQAARRKSIGKGKVAKNSRADKYLPA